MPAFYILAFVAAICLWFGCSRLFRVIGNIFLAMYEDIEDAIADEEYDDKFDE